MQQVAKSLLIAAVFLSTFLLASGQSVCFKFSPSFHTGLQAYYTDPYDPDSPPPQGGFNGLFGTDNKVVVQIEFCAGAPVQGQVLIPGTPQFRRTSSAFYRRVSDAEQFSSRFSLSGGPTLQTGENYTQFQYTSEYEPVVQDQYFLRATVVSNNLANLPLYGAGIGTPAVWAVIYLRPIPSVTGRLPTTLDEIDLSSLQMFIESQESSQEWLAFQRAFLLSVFHFSFSLTVFISHR